MSRRTPLDVPRKSYNIDVSDTEGGATEEEGEVVVVLPGEERLEEKAVVTERCIGKGEAARAYRHPCDPPKLQPGRTSKTAASIGTHAELRAFISLPARAREAGWGGLGLRR
jgi:hypothetical protein